MWGPGPGGFSAAETLICVENPTEMVAMRPFPAANSRPGLWLPQFPCGCPGAGKGNKPGGFTSGPSLITFIRLCPGNCFLGVLGFIFEVLVE